MIDKKAINNVIELLELLKNKADTIQDKDAIKDINDMIDDFIIKSYDDIKFYIIEANKKECELLNELY